LKRFFHSGIIGSSAALFFIVVFMMFGSSRVASANASCGAIEDTFGIEFNANEDVGRSCSIDDFTDPASGFNSPGPAVATDVTPFNATVINRLEIFNNLLDDNGENYINIIVTPGNLNGSVAGTFSPAPTATLGSRYVFTAAQVTAGIDVQVVAGSTTYSFRIVGTGVTIDAFAVVPAPATANTSAQQAREQQLLATQLMARQHATVIANGVQNAIAERFFGSDGTQVSFANSGRDISAYASLHGIGATARQLRQRRLALYAAPEAIHAIDQAAGTSEQTASVPTAQVGAVSSYVPTVDAITPSQAGQISVSDVAEVNAWATGALTHYDGDAFSGDTWNGVAGIDYLITSNVLLGILGGHEQGNFSFDPTNGAFDGDGFTVGAYVGVQLSDSLVADAFFTHSWLNFGNRVVTATGSTDASRFMVSFNVTGQYAIADNVTLEPNARVFYAHEKQDAYTLSDATVIAANSVTSGRISVGPRLRYLIAMDGNSSWSVTASAHGEYDLSSENQTNTALPDFDGLLSARLALGIDGTFSNGWSVSLAGDVGGIGSSGFTSFTGSGRLSIPFH
jgi:hypothetical protein